LERRKKIRVNGTHWRFFKNYLKQKIKKTIKLDTII